MKALIFERNGVVLDGSYLCGVARFGGPARLLAAELTGVRFPPLAGVLRLELEVGGVLTGLAFSVTPQNGETRQSLTLGCMVPAQAVMRWRASFTGQPADAAMDVAITVSVGPVLAAQPVSAQVIWTDGSARVPLYAFSNGAYVPLAPGRATMDAAGEGIWLDGALVLSVGYLGLEAASWREGSLTAKGSRLEFWLGSACVGVLSAAGMQARQLTEADDLPNGAGFTLGTSDTVSAVLGTGGLVATGLAENDE